jgi:hypothetical protein
MLWDGNALHFDWWKYGGYDARSNSIPRCMRKTLDKGTLQEKRNDSRVINETLSGYAPAGRLDINLRGVMLFMHVHIVA